MPKELTLTNFSQRPYVKVSFKQRETLKKLVFKKGQMIINAAEMLNIKYATAKSIINKCRKQKIKKRDISAVRQCSYKNIVRDLIPILNLVTFVGGSIMSNNSYYLL